MEQQIKPHRNLFEPTIAQKNKHLTTTALLPKAKYYRTYLEPYLNDVVYIECARWYIKPDFVDGRPGDQILLLDLCRYGFQPHPEKPFLLDKNKIHQIHRVLVF